MSCWDEIDRLKKKLVEEKREAVERLKEAGYRGEINNRLEFDGQCWVFAACGKKHRARTLAGLLEVALLPINLPRRAP